MSSSSTAADTPAVFVSFFGTVRPPERCGDGATGASGPAKRWLSVGVAVTPRR